MTSPDVPDRRRAAIGQQPARARFHLRGRELGPAERRYVVDVIRRWIEREAGRLHADDPGAHPSRAALT